MKNLTPQKVAAIAYKVGANPATDMDIINGRLYLNANYWAG